mgnify:CR=1 FL=1
MRVVPNSLEDLINQFSKLPGIGKKKRLLLLKNFGSLDAIRDASLIQLQAVPGITENLAREIANTLGREQITNT